MQNSLQEAPPYESTALDHSVIFNGTSWADGKTVTASKPIAVLCSLEALDSYITKHPELRLLDNAGFAGFAGYIGYEGDCEFGVYENIQITPSSATQPLSHSVTQIIPPDPQSYISAIKKCQQYIHEGDIYQANLAHRFIIESNHQHLTAKTQHHLDLYKRLYSMNSSPYTGYMNFSDYEIISSSPELFLEIKPSGLVRSSPIKGTAKLNEFNELLNSDKERAEHIMIVDLIRNDLGQVCETGSVTVEKLLYTQKLSNLYHLVSDITGQLVLDQGSINFTKLFTAMCPGGSISGTPKIRALEIIKELESSPRGLYTGTMGYYRFKDGGKFSMLIRSLIYSKKDNILSFHSGAGITAGSDPEKELEETYLKAEKLLEVFQTTQ